MQEIAPATITAHEAIHDPANRAGVLALALKLEARFLAESDPRPTEPGQRALALSDQLIKVLRTAITPPTPSEKRPWIRFDEYAPIELHYAAEGITEIQSAAVRGIALQTVKTRLGIIKSRLNTNTRGHMVAEAIQQGFVPIVPDESGYEALSPREQMVLSFVAGGWRSKDIAQYLKINQKTVDRHYEEVRHKLGARKIEHAVKRAFELGIFKVGQPVETPDSIGQFRISVIGDEGEDKTSVLIQDPREIELLKAIRERANGGIWSHEVLDTDFDRVASPKSRLSVFGNVIFNLANKLETSDGKPLLAKRKLRINGKRVARYEFQQPILVEGPDESYIIPATKKETPMPPVPKPKPKSKKKKAPKPKPVKQVKVKSQPEVKPPVVEVSRPEPQLPPEVLAADELAPLEDLLPTLRPRSTAELNVEVIRAVYDLLPKLHPSYRQKTVLLLRYGISQKSLHFSHLRRGDKLINIEDVSSNFVWSGLDLDSASSLSGLSAYGILKCELDMLTQFKGSCPAIDKLHKHIEKELKKLLESEQTK